MGILKNKGFPSQLIQAAQILYKNTSITIEKWWEVEKLIAEINKGVSQGCPLSHIF